MHFVLFVQEQAQNFGRAVVPEAHEKFAEVEPVLAGHVDARERLLAECVVVELEQVEKFVQVDSLRIAIDGRSQDPRTCPAEM